MSLPPHVVPAATFPPPLSHARSSFSLSTATPLLIPPNTLVLDPPPVSKQHQEPNFVCQMQWNQCPYWGALDTELHNRVFLGCRNISFTVCRSIAHSTITRPFINPSIPPCPEPSQPWSTSYDPRLLNTSTNPSLPTSTNRRPLSSSGSQVCARFNSGRCSRQRWRFMHICNFCGGAHARLICPVQKAANKNAKQYLSTPVNVSHLSSELLYHPDSHFSDYLLSGLSHGFHPGVEKSPLPKPHLPQSPIHPRRTRNSRSSN